MARHYIEFRIWIAPTLNAGLATAVANQIKDELNDFVRDVPVTVRAITYAIKHEEERWPLSDPLSVPEGTTIH